MVGDMRFELTFARVRGETLIIRGIPDFGCATSTPAEPQGLSADLNRSSRILVAHLGFEPRPGVILSHTPLPVGLVGRKVVGATGLEPA